MSTEKERETHVYMANQYGQAERYDEMVEHMKNVAMLNVELSVKERNLLAIAYKRAIGEKRMAWRIMSSIEQKKETQEKDNNVKLAEGDLWKVEGEISMICNDFLSVIDNHLIPSSENVENTVFYYKLKGDYHRYLAEFKKGQDKEESAEESLKAYEAASATANAELPPTHSIRLALALNFSVFYYEIMNSFERAFHIAKQAFDEASGKPDSLSEDSNLIMKLLSDNLALWNSDLLKDGGTAVVVLPPSEKR